MLVTSAQSRRRFLGRLTAAAATLAARPLTAAAAGPPTNSAKGAAGAAPVRVALFSDTHIPADAAESYNGFRPVENLGRALPAMIESHPEAAILSGDAARLQGLEPDYRRLQAMLAPLVEECPVAVAMGNHDDRVTFRRVFTGKAPGAVKVADRQVMVFEWPAIRLIVLDSLLFVNKTPGLLGKAQRTWLADFLEREDTRPTALVMHHPPDDGDGSLLDSDRLLTLVRPFRHVKALIFGHSHVWNCRTLDRLQLINLPAVGYNFNASQPVGWVEARFAQNGVDLKLHAVGGNRAEDGWTTSIPWR